MQGSAKKKVLGWARCLLLLVIRLRSMKFFSVNLIEILIKILFRQLHKSQAFWQTQSFPRHVSSKLSLHRQIYASLGRWLSEQL